MILIKVIAQYFLQSQSTIFQFATAQVDFFYLFTFYFHYLHKDYCPPHFTENCSTGQTLVDLVWIFDNNSEFNPWAEQCTWTPW